METPGFTQREQQVIDAFSAERNSPNTVISTERLKELLAKEAELDALNEVLSKL